MVLKVTSKWFVRLAGFLLLSCGLAGGQDTAKAKKELPPVGVGSLDSIAFQAEFEGIAKAWQKGDAESLALYLGEGRVTIQLPKVVGGVLSKSQAEYVLRDLFKYTVTEKFEFTKYDEFVSEGIVGIADRTYRSGKEGLAIKDKISVWLVKEGEDKPRWVIKEIRAK